jgi:hypothetical protein
MKLDQTKLHSSQQDSINNPTEASSVLLTGRGNNFPSLHPHRELRGQDIQSLDPDEEVCFRDSKR